MSSEASGSGLMVLVPTTPEVCHIILYQKKRSGVIGGKGTINDPTKPCIISPLALNS